jgi:hypothetical protein
MKVARQSSPREGINSGCGFDFRWGGNGADGRSGHEARGAGGGSVLLEEGQGWGSALYQCGGGVEEGGRWEAATRQGEAGTTTRTGRPAPARSRHTWVSGGWSREAGEAER